MPIRVPLRYTRLVSREPYIELDGPAFRLRLPWIFDEVWNLNAADVAVVVVADQSTGGDDSGNGWVFEVPICIPYAATEHPTSKPNLMLLFKTPQRIPPLRPSGAKAIGWSSFNAQGSAGIQIDGLELHARDPHAAGVTLAFAGLERVDRPNLWLRHHRRVTQDPSLVQAAETTGRARQSGTVSGRQVSAGGRAVGGPAKRRRVWVSLFIGVAIAVAGPHLLAWARAHVTGSAYSATPFTAANESFSVTLPAKAKLEPETRPALGIVSNGVTAESRDGDVMVEQLSISPDVIFDGQAGMRGSVDQVAKESGGTVSDYREVPYGRYVGVVATVKGGSGVAKMLRMRLVYTGKSMVILGCSDSVYDRTVASLRIP